MKPTKSLIQLYEDSRGDDYCSVEKFVALSKSFIKDLKKGRIISSIKVSRSGMSRKFNTDQYNFLLNVCYNRKKSWNPVKVNGCGMDMYWDLLFRTCLRLLTSSEMEKYNINRLCSEQKFI